jgi:surfeit locus 1 family protein
LVGRLRQAIGAGRGLLPLTIAAALAFATLIGLGYWQLERRAEKQAERIRIEQRLSAPLVGAGDLKGAPADLDYRRVRLDGRFLHGAEMHLVGRARKAGVGVGILTPFAYEGGMVLVDRGWVPADRRSPELRQPGNPEGMVRVEGALRLPARPGRFTPDNQPGTNEWFWPDLAAMARQAGLDPAAVLGLVLVAGPAANPGGLPVGAALKPDLADNHLQYALTWFALALILAVMYGLLARRWLKTQGGLA